MVTPRFNTFKAIRILKKNARNVWGDTKKNDIDI